jgi:uncharacterized Zn finger protein
MTVDKKIKCKSCGNTERVERTKILEWRKSPKECILISHPTRLECDACGWVQAQYKKDYRIVRRWKTTEN